VAITAGCEVRVAGSYSGGQWIGTTLRVYYPPSFNGFEQDATGNPVTDGDILGDAQYQVWLISSPSLDTDNGSSADFTCTLEYQELHGTLTLDNVIPAEMQGRLGMICTPGVSSEAIYPWADDSFVAIGIYRKAISWCNQNPIENAVSGLDGRITSLEGGSGTGGGIRAIDDFVVGDSPVTLTSAHHFVRCDATSGPITLNLPSASTSNKQDYFVKKIDNSANVINIVPDGTDTIQGESSIVAISENSTYYLACDGTKWEIILTGFGRPISDDTPPSVTITTPTTTGSWSQTESAITVSGTAEDLESGITSMSYEMTGDTTGTGPIAITPGASISWSTALSLNVGTTTITITAINGDALESTDVLSVTYSLAAATQGFTSGGNSGIMSHRIDKFNFTSNSSATDHGDLSVARERAAGQSSNAQGFTSGGNSGSVSNVIDKFDFTSNVTATDHGNLSASRERAAGQQG